MELGAFEVALKVIEASCGALVSFTLAPGKNKFMVMGTNAGSQAVFNIPGSLPGLDSPVEIVKDTFMQAIKGRSEADVTLSDGDLVIQAGRYKQSLRYSDTKNIVEIGEPAEAQAFVMTPDLHSALAKTLPLLRIERTHTALPDVMVHLRFTSKSAFYVTYDSQQMCFLGTKNATGSEMTVTLPYTRFSAFIKDLPVANAKVFVSADSIVAITKQFSVQIAIPVVDESSLDPDTVFGKAREVSKVESDKMLTIPKTELQGFLENAKALVAIGTEVQFVATKRGTKLLVDSPKGKAELGIKVANPAGTFGLDYRYVQTLLLKASDSLSFFVVDDTFAVSKADVTYVALLSANTASASE